MTALAFLVTVAYIPGIPGFAYVPRWAVLAIGIPLLLFFVRAELDRGQVLALTFVGYATLSLTWSPVFVEAIHGWFKLALLAGAFWAATQVERLDQVYAAFGAGICVSAAIAILQFFGMKPVDYVEAALGTPGLFGNKNFFGEAATMALIGVVATRQWVWVPGCLLAAVLTQCRGAWIGLGVAGTVWLWQRQRVLAVLVIVIMVLGVRLVIGTAVNSAIGERLAIWGDTISGLSIAGRGVGSYHVTVAEHGERMAQRLTRTQHAHNDLLEAVFEYGIGSIALILLIAYCLCGPNEPARLVLAGFLGAGLVGFPFHQPATAFLAAVVAGHLCGTRARLRRERPDGGVYREVRHALWNLEEDRTVAAAAGGAGVSLEPLPAQPARARGAGGEPDLAPGIRDRRD